MFHDTAPGAPQYAASDGGCVCAPGEPWVGDGSGAGCDTRVITSFDRLIDTAGCELTPKGAPLPVPVCDGQTVHGRAGRSRAAVLEQGRRRASAA